MPQLQAVVCWMWIYTPLKCTTIQSATNIGMTLFSDFCILNHKSFTLTWQPGFLVCLFTMYCAYMLLSSVCMHSTCMSSVLYIVFMVRNKRSLGPTGWHKS